MHKATHQTLKTKQKGAAAKQAKPTKALAVSVDTKCTESTNYVFEQDKSPTMDQMIPCFVKTKTGHWRPRYVLV